MKYRLALLLVLCGFIVGTASAWYDSDWDYRKSFTINNTGSNLTNYQIMFTVNRSSGTDSGTTVYLNGKCQDDYDDIRFVAADDTTLYDYWVESNTSTVATVWVEFSSLSTGDTDCYLYYNNTGASAVSNGTTTFQFFDDFPGSSVDTGKWTVGGSPTVSSDEITIHANSDSLKGKTGFGTNYALRIRCKYAYLEYSKGPHFGFLAYSGTNQVMTWRTDPGGILCVYTILSGANSRGGLSSNPPVNTYHTFEVVRNGSTSASLVLPGYTTGTVTTNIPTDTEYPYLYGASTNVICDWVAVRKYTATAPTVSAWGSEEETFPKSIIADFTGLPTTGNVPLTVYFTDNSTSNNCTIDTWHWSFGDSTSNATSENPAHTYTTTGLYDVILTVTNTSFSLTNSTKKTGYINVTCDPNAPTADFTVTELCGETTDTFYFIDFSTGGGLYAWNWSFGDGSYSELRNPTHQYASEGTYDVNLSVWGAYGFDSLLRENLITIPCGAATPTPTPTVTVTGTGNVTEGNATYIYAPDQDYVPFPIWLAIVIVTIALFGHSLIFLKNSDLTAIMAALFAMLSAWLSNMIGYIDVQVTSYAEEIVISPVVQAVHPPWLVYTMLIFAFVSVVNIFAAIYKVYLKPVPWNEIYDRKLPKWGRRK